MAGWWRRSQQSRDDDLERELKTHLDLEAEEQEAMGVPRREAGFAARRAFGNTTLVKGEVRAMWTWTTIEQILQDIRYVLRGARRSPGFTAIAVLSLALGIGATTAVFSVLNAVVLRPLPVPDSDRLVLLQAELRNKRFVLFNPIFEEVRATQQTLSAMAAISNDPYLKSAFEGGTPAYVRASLVSGNYFEMLGVTAALGRVLTPRDDLPATTDCAAVLSHAYWRTSLRSDPGVLGRPVIARDKPCTIVGVAAESFRSHEPGFAPDLWLPIVPMTDAKLLASRTMAFYSGVLGRLRSGVSPGQAESELTTIYQRIQAANPGASPRPGEAPPKPSDFQIVIRSGAQGLDAMKQVVGPPLMLALAVVGVVLLIATVNIANLLLARGAARTTELATRAALGAGRIRLMRLLAVEGATLAVAGGAIGIALALAIMPALAQAVPHPYKMIALDTSPDIRVLGVAIAATMFAALLAGLVPALRLSRQSLQVGRGAASRTAGSRSAQRTTRVLVAGQLALSLLLVSSAGLLLRTMLRVMSVDPGFKADQVVLMDIRDTEPARYGEVETPEKKARRAATYLALDDRLNAIPGVQAASVSWLGLFGGNYVGLNLYDAARPEDKRFTLVDYVSPRYFESVGMQLMRGRGITGLDREGSMRAAVVNEAFVRERIPQGAEAIGRRFVMTYADDLRPFTIVGIARDAKYNDLRELKTEPMMWVPLAQAPVQIRSVSLRIRQGQEAAVTQEARRVLTATGPHLMVRTVTTLEAQVDNATQRERLLLRLASTFGTLALVLAAVGLYGTLAYAVAQRTREIGVRLALGAQRSSVLRLVLRESLLLVAGGMLVGIPLSIGAGHLLRSFLFGVTAYDLPALIGASVILAAVSLLAALAPARRASRVDPMLALKYE